MLSILQRHPAHPSHHHLLCPLQTFQIFKPSSLMFQSTYSGHKLFPPYAVWCTTSCQDRNSLNFARAHVTRDLAASSTPPPAPSMLPKLFITWEYIPTMQIGFNHTSFSPTDYSKRSDTVVFLLDTVALTIKNSNNNYIPGGRIRFVVPNRNVLRSLGRT